MSAADRVVVRTREGVRVVPRRAALGMIARGSAKAAPRHAKPKPVKRKDAAVPVVTKPVEVRVPRVAAKSPTARVLPAAGSVPVETPDDFKAGRSVADRPNHPKSKARAAAARVAESVPVAAVMPVDPVVDVVEPAADDVTALPISAPAADTNPPRLNASRKAWAQYASQVRGVTVTSDMTRNQLRDMIATMDHDRMSQPAFTEHSVTGGRLATPEDVPVTESVVTHASPDSAGA